jgi:hypothetical protein
MEKNTPFPPQKVAGEDIKPIIRYFRALSRAARPKSYIETTLFKRWWSV